MKTADALKRAREILGPKAILRDYGPKAAPSPELRAAARAELTALRATSRKENYERRTELLGICVSFRFAVGVPYTIPGLGGGMVVRGTGDTWEEALAEAAKS